VSETTSPPWTDAATASSPPQGTRRRRRGGLALLLGLTLFAGGLAIAVVAPRRSVPRITLTDGPLGTTRALLARALIAAATARGADARLAKTMGTEDELERVETRAVDFALVSGVVGFGAHAHVREVAPLHLEALHLVVRADLAEAVGQRLGALRGRTVDLGPRGTATALLAEAVMAFAGLTPGDGMAPDTFVARYLDYADLDALMVGGDGEARPDAFFHLAAVPSKVVLRALRAAPYRLVALPFAEAFRMNAIIAEPSSPGSVTDIDRLSIADTVIPAFTYRTEPAEPPAPLHTVGGRLLLVAHEDVPVESVELLLDAAFGSRFARLAEPHLHHSLLELPPHMTRHAGTLAYRKRGDSLITNQTVDELSNTLSILGALLGGGFFVRQWQRERARSRRDETFASCILRVANVERRVAELELGATLELEPLAALERDLLQLKSEALERFAAGELGDHTALGSLLTPLNSARAHIGELILHVRDNLEERAETEGRTAQTLWTEAIGKSGETS
jgi:TRAP-type uncharacterized transport system substrate-binding protein